MSSGKINEEACRGRLLSGSKTLCSCMLSSTVMHYGYRHTALTFLNPQLAAFSRGSKPSGKQHDSHRSCCFPMGLGTSSAAFLQSRRSSNSISRIPSRGDISGGLDLEACHGTRVENGAGLACLDLRTVDGTSSTGSRGEYINCHRRL